MEFYRMFSDYYNSIFPFSASKEKFFSDLINKYQPRSALDLGCASGELTGFLCSRGCATTGIDLSSDLLALARNQPGTFLETDMVDYLENTAPVPVDLIVSIGNTLPHLTPGKLARFINLLPLWLNPGGLLVVQTVNYHKILTERPPGLPTITRPKPRVKFTRLYDYHADGSIAFTAILENPHGQGKATVKLWPFTSSEFISLLPPDTSAVREFGSFDGQPYDHQKSPAWVLVAQKKYL